MDADRFDVLTQRFSIAPTRRAALRALGIGAFAALLAQPERAAAACKNDGGKCGNDNDCCSGICKNSGKKKHGHRRKKKCEKNADARGCTIEDECSSENSECPEFAEGSCAVTVGGKPFCFTDGECFACESNDDCVTEFGVANARCIKCPIECDEEFNFRACVIFDPTPSM